MLNGLPFTLGMWAFGRGGAKEANLYNVAKEQFEMVDHRLPFRISPDEKNRLETTSTSGPQGRLVISVRPLEAKADLWKYEHSVPYVPNDPFWLQDDVIAMNGTYNTRAEIVRLNGKTGAVVWRYPLPRGAYSSQQDGLNNRRSPSDEWSAIHYTGKHILALGADGEIILLDPKTGQRAGSLQPSDAYLVCPRVVGDCVVYCTTKEITAVPLDLVLAKPRAVDERHAIALKAQCLASLNRAEEGLKELRDVLQVFPNFAEGWAVKADLCRKLKLPMEEADARCRRLEATGKDHDPVLDEDYGLIKRLATGEKFTSGPVILGDQFYVGSQSGHLYEYEVGTLELAGKTDLQAASYDSKVLAELRLGRDGTKTVPDDAVLTKTPYPWGNLAPPAGKVVRYKGHYVRPAGGGAVRHLYPDGKLETHDTPLQEIGRWDIYLGPGGPLGHGAGGVYNLDANLAPQSYRIKLGRDTTNKFLFTALHVASDGKTIGLTTYADREWLLQVWSHDGKKKLREERMLPAHYPSHYERPRLYALFDGHLLVGHEVAWVPADADRPVRRFALQRSQRESTWHMDPTTQSFLPPTLTPTRMLIPAADGAIYVFDTARFVGSQKK